MNLANPMTLILRIHSLSKAYPIPGREPLKIIEDLNLQLRLGESLGILGTSGSGKSTLLSLVSGLDRADQGEIFIEETDLCILPESQLDEFRASRIGIVFQQFHLLPNLNALENVALPLRLRKDRLAHEKSRDVLERVGLGSRWDHLPARLSGGECQRVALARALVIEPAILLADEPTGNLDSKSSQRVWSLMQDLVSCSKTSLILVTHNLELAHLCDRTTTLSEGSLHESPAPSCI